MSLDYPYTCPQIDRVISGIEEEIEEWFEYITEYVKEDDRDNIPNWVKRVSDDVVAHVEDIRKINSDMRDAADKQIKTLQEEIEDLEDDLENKGSTIEALEDRIDRLEETISDLQDSIVE